MPQYVDFKVKYWVILHDFLLPADLFLQFFFQNTIIVLNSLGPDQTRHFVGPDMGPNFLKRLSADDTLRESFN